MATGGAGADYLDGGAGDDIYLLDSGDSGPGSLGETEAIVDNEGQNRIEPKNLSYPIPSA